MAEHVTEICKTHAIKPDTPLILIVFLLQIQHSAPEIVRFYKPLSSNPNTVATPGKILDMHQNLVKLRVLPQIQYALRRGFTYTS